MTSTTAAIPPRRYYNWHLSGFFGPTTPKEVQGTAKYMDAWWAMVLSCDPVVPSQGRRTMRLAWPLAREGRDGSGLQMGIQF